MNDQDLSARHLSAQQVAAYVERTLSAERRLNVEAHLADCAECRDEIAAVAALMKRFDRPARGHLLWPIAAAAAIVLLFALPSRTDDPQGSAMRTGAGEGVPTITVIAPATGDTLSIDSIRLIWRSFAPDARYQLRLTTAEGSEVWRASMSDTTAVPPREVGLIEGHTYFWYVDALLPDGTSATTGIRRFTVGP